MLGCDYICLVLIIDPKTLLGWTLGEIRSVINGEKRFLGNSGPKLASR